MEPRSCRRLADDLQQTYDYIGKEKSSPTAADKLLDGIEVQIQRYAESPGMGAPHGEMDIRFCRYKSYVIFYRPITDAIHVLRVLHGSRDHSGLFRQASDNGPE